MQQDGPRTPFEVYCHNCRVTAPAGARRCVHCGNRLGRERFRPVLELPPGSENVLGSEDLPKRTGPFSPFTLVWIVLLLGGYLYRACTT
jgi:hypothetical protein